MRSLFDALDAYLTEESPAVRPAQAMPAVATPVTSDEVALTNHAWEFSMRLCAGTCASVNSAC
jgi:glucokinase